MEFNKAIKFLTSVIVCELAGVVGAFFTTPQIKIWYSNIDKPSFNPPSWIFGPVWTILFILMGISLYIVWQKKWQPENKIFSGKRKTWNKLSQKFFSGSWQRANIILIFSLQLALNVLWSVIFFGMHLTGAAFFELLMLWSAVIFTIINFYRVSKITVLLLLPYILWVSFALILNYSIWMLN